MAVQSTLELATRRIETIRRGDRVLAKDQNDPSAPVRRYVVEETYIRTIDHLRLLTIRDSLGRQQTLKTTDDHPFYILHDELRPGALRPRSDKLNSQVRGEALFEFIAKSRELVFWQEAGFEDKATINDLATALRGFVLRLTSVLQPRFAWIDVAGESAPSASFANRLNLTQAFWTMIFGLEFTAKFGRSFLLDAPAWQVEDLGDRGVMLTVSENYTDWLKAPELKFLEYLRQRTPMIKPYRYKPIL